MPSDEPDRTGDEAVAPESPPRAEEQPQPDPTRYATPRRFEVDEESEADAASPKDQVPDTDAAGPDAPAVAGKPRTTNDVLGTAAFADLVTASDLLGKNYAAVLDSFRKALPVVDTSSYMRGLNALTQPHVLKALSDTQVSASQQLAQLAARVAHLQPLIDVRSVNDPQLSPPRYKAEPEGEPESYSPELQSPDDYWSRDEQTINSFAELNTAITDLIATYPDLPLVWRGVRDASWALHSALFRRLADLNGVTPPGKDAFGKQPFPTEEQMVEAERRILVAAREQFRFDQMSALEIFARVQHDGGPTRLLDVTKNPHIAAWFAVETNPATDDRDARLFALATSPIWDADEPPRPESDFTHNDYDRSLYPFWHSYPTAKERKEHDWGTGTRRHLWFPPNYSPRIAAQMGGFVVDGVPIRLSQTTSYFRRGARTYWSRADLLASASIYARTEKPDAARPNKPHFLPTFSYRITTEAKAEIRQVLEKRFGYSFATIYPDVPGLARFVSNMPLREQD